MQLIEIPLDQLWEAPWNPNQLDLAMMHKLRASLAHYGQVENFVVRPLDSGSYEVLSGNHRLQASQDLGHTTAPCVVVDLNDTDDRLLAQALNRIQGEDDLGLRAVMMRRVLEDIPRVEVLAFLPESADSLNALCSLGQEDLARSLQAWQQAQGVRLNHLQFQVTTDQLDVVQEALARLLPAARQTQGDSPNARGTALYLLCKDFLERGGEL